MKSGQLDELEVNRVDGFSISVNIGIKDSLAVVRKVDRVFFQVTISSIRPCAHLRAKLALQNAGVVKHLISFINKAISKQKGGTFLVQ